MGRLKAIIQAIWLIWNIIKKAKMVIKIFKDIPWGKLKRKFFKRKDKNESNDDDNSGSNSSNK